MALPAEQLESILDGGAETPSVDFRDLIHVAQFAAVDCRGSRNTWGCGRFLGLHYAAKPILYL